MGLSATMGLPPHSSTSLQSSATSSGSVTAPEALERGAQILGLTKTRSPLDTNLRRPPSRSSTRDTSRGFIVLRMATDMAPPETGL